MLLQCEIITWLRHLLLTFSLMPITNNCSEACGIWYGNKSHISLRDIRLPPQCKWDLWSSDILRITEW